MSHLYNTKTFESPFSTRYGSETMRQVWSEGHRRRLWRKIWVAIAEAQAEYGLVTEEQLKDLKLHINHIDLPIAREIEKEVRHELVAELKTFAHQCEVGGSILHRGATSADITDNADVLQQREAIDLLLKQMGSLLSVLADRIEQYAGLACMGYTHLQPAEPTTLGYRLAFYGQDLLYHYIQVKGFREILCGKGLKGPVGTGASLPIPAGGRYSINHLESDFGKRIDLLPFEITNQTYPRLQDFEILSALSSMAGSLHKMALDFRILQSYGVLSEPFYKEQVGSSAMPWKHNPILCEKICSLARLVASFLTVAWQNMAQSALERTLDDSANRRVIFPEAFLATEEILMSATEVLQGLQVGEVRCRSELSARKFTNGTGWAEERAVAMAQTIKEYL